MNSKGNNMKQDHIDYNTLSMYVKAVSYGNATIDKVGMDGEQYHYVLDHIASCSECREQVTAITTLLNDHAYIDHQSELTPEKQKFICNYLEGKLHAKEAAEAKALIETNDDAMKAALHYQNHAESMKSHLAIENTLKSEVTESTKVQKLNASFFGQITSMFDQLFSMKSPLIYTMTATATLLFAVMLIINSSEMTQQQTMIASYQDNPTIQFTEKNKLPGVGFFAQSGNMSSPFEDINIEQVLVYNSIGQVCVSIQSFRDIDKVNIQNLQKGMYHLVVMSEGSVSTDSQTLLVSCGKAGCSTPTPNSELGKPDVTERISMPGNVSRKTW